MATCESCYRDVDTGVVCEECGGLKEEQQISKELRTALKTLLEFVDHEIAMGRMKPLHRCESTPCNCSLDVARRTLEAYS